MVLASVQLREHFCLANVWVTPILHVRYSTQMLHVAGVSLLNRPRDSVLSLEKSRNVWVQRVKNRFVWNLSGSN